jgi:hypothetical protein
MLMAKQEEVQQSALGAWAQGLHPAMAAYLELHIRRDHILEDALHQVPAPRLQLPAPHSADPRGQDSQGS